VSCTPARVRAYLDTARHKLGCVNLTHMIGIAFATGIIPAHALRGSSTSDLLALDPLAQ
jgi:hypothetical protein